MKMIHFVIGTSEPEYARNGRNMDLWGSMGPKTAEKTDHPNMFYGTCYFVLLSELQQPIFRNTASAKAEAHSLPCTLSCRLRVVGSTLS